MFGRSKEKPKASGPSSRYDKMTRFLPPAGDYSLQNEFECWHPDPMYAFSETAGAVGWNGPEIPSIKAGDEVSAVDLPSTLINLVKNCWQMAKVPTGAARGGVQLGGARQQAFGSLPQNVQTRMQADGKHYKFVSPTYDDRIGDAGYKMDALKHLGGVANDWKVHEEMERICAYTFRGDKRSPVVIRTSGGFSPPISRTDRWYTENVVAPQFVSYMTRRFNVPMSPATFLKIYDGTLAGDAAKQVMQMFALWRMLIEGEALHAGRMVAFEALKGYISTTRATCVAKGFASGQGWVYFTMVPGGFVLPPKAKHKWTPLFGEQEIAFPGALTWQNIVGFRQVGGDLRFVGPLYFRKGFESTNLRVFREGFDLLSGKGQG